MSMGRGEPSKLARAMTWLVLALTVVLIVLGVSWYGLSMEVQRTLLGRSFRPRPWADDVPVLSAAGHGRARRAA